mgnify:CR=1 FL=1
MSVREPASAETAATDAATRAADRIIATRPAYAPFVQSFSAYTATVDQASALAWRVSVGAMALLVVLAVTIPAGRAWYVGWAIESKAASVRAVENALGLEIPLNAQYIRNLIVAAHAMHDHIVHFYQLSALDWVDVTSALKADPVKTAALAARIGLGG